MPPGPLRSRNFRLLLACDVISASGTAVATVAPRAGLVHGLREGWRDFISRRWLWVIVAQFAFVVAILTGTQSVWRAWPCPPIPCFCLALAVPVAVPVIAATAFAAGASVEVFSVNWATTMQQEIPPAMLSRLSSYDALRSFALPPVGTTVAGPMAGSCSRGETATLT